MSTLLAYVFGLLGPPAWPWPGGVYHADSTGGKCIALPEARRCGIDIARLGAGSLELQWGLWCGLPCATPDCHQK